MDHKRTLIPEGAVSPNQNLYGGYKGYINIICAVYRLMSVLAIWEAEISPKDSVSDLERL